MKKNVKKLGLIFTIAASLVLTTGCGKKDATEDVNSMIDKYSGYCSLGDYKGIEYVERKTIVTEDDVQYQVNSLLESYATSEEVTSGVANDGDTVNIDYVGTVDGVEFEGGSSEGQGFELTLGSGYMIDGFEEQIVGHSVGETFDINVTFPEQYTAELAGKDAVFAITINSKIEKTYPDYNDAFVSANTSYATVAEYEKYLMDSMTESATSSDEDYNKNAIMTAVIEASTVNEYPQKEMQELIDDTVQEVEDGAVSSGYTLEAYVTGFYGMTSVEEFEIYVGDIVKSYMTEKIVVCSIAKAEGMTVSDEDVKAYKAEMMEVLGIDEKTLTETYSDEDIAYYTLAEKVVDFLLENGTPVEATATDATE